MHSSHAYRLFDSVSGCDTLAVMPKASARVVSPPSCPKCGRPMLYIFREEQHEELEIRLFECRHCDTEMTVHVLSDD